MIKREHYNMINGSSGSFQIFRWKSLKCTGTPKKNLFAAADVSPKQVKM